MEITDFTGIFESAGKFAASTYEELCITLIAFAEKSRREGLLALEDDLECIDNNLMRKVLQLVVDGTDPDLVKSIGENYIESTRHYLEEILLCVEFAILNGDKKDYENIFNHYVQSRGLGVYANIVNSISMEIDAARVGELQYDGASDRYKDLMKMLRPDIDDQFRREIITNHIKTILYNNRIYNRMILMGILSIQSGDNPRIIKDKLFSYVHPLSFTDTDDECIK